jgi:hypothetical protein
MVVRYAGPLRRPLTAHLGQISASEVQALQHEDT